MISSQPTSLAYPTPASIESKVRPSKRSGVCTVWPASRNSFANMCKPSVGPSAWWKSSTSAIVFLPSVNVSDSDRIETYSLPPTSRPSHRIGAPSAHNWEMVEISDDDFERMVSEVFDALPDDMVRGVENVGIVVENQPLAERPRLFGQYRGHPLTTRGVYGFGELPDRITLYKNNLQEHSADLDSLRARVRITLVHEIGHYFGLDDARLHELGWA